MSTSAAIDLLLACALIVAVIGLVGLGTAYLTVYVAGALSLLALWQIGKVLQARLRRRSPSMRARTSTDTGNVASADCRSK